MDTRQRKSTTSEPPDPGDFLSIEELLSEEELAVRDDARAFVRERIAPNIKDWYERAHFPRELVTEMGERGFLGMHLSGYGAPVRAPSSTGWPAWSS